MTWDTNSFWELVADWTIITTPFLTFSRAPSSLDEPFKHFFSFPVCTLYTLKKKHTSYQLRSSGDLCSVKISLNSNLMFRSWQAMAMCVLDESRSMSYRVVFSTTWWLLENDKPSAVWTTTDMTRWMNQTQEKTLYFILSSSTSSGFE